MNDWMTKAKSKIANEENVVSNRCKKMAKKMSYFGFDSAKVPFIDCSDRL